MGFDVPRGSCEGALPFGEGEGGGSFLKSGTPFVPTAGRGCAPERCQPGKLSSPEVRASL